MPKFRKKPVVIEAEQYDSHLDLPFIDRSDLGLNGFSPVEYDEDSKRAYIKTLEGKLYVTHGDWIIRGTAGEFYPCKPDIFNATYDPVA